MRSVPQEMPQTLVYIFYGLIAWALSAVFAGFRILANEKLIPGIAMRIGILIWLGVPAILAFQGVFLDFASTPPALMKVIGVMVLVIFVFTLSPWGKRAAEKLPETLLVGTQVFRVPLEIVLFSLAGKQLLPEAMTFSGYNFDIITGALALPLWWKLRQLSAPRWALWAWNTIGLVLLLTVISIAVMSFPQPFGFFTPHNVIVSFYPWIWLPTFLVPLALTSHLLLFRKLMLPVPSPGPNV